MILQAIWYSCEWNNPVVGIYDFCRINLTSRNMAVVQLRGAHVSKPFILFFRWFILTRNYFIQTILARTFLYNGPSSNNGHISVILLWNA